MIDEEGKALRFDSERCCLIDAAGRPVPPLDPNHVAEAAEPEVRFRDVLSHVWWCFQCFGVVRRDALLRTSRHGNYWGADKVLLAELALLGRFYQVREQLFAQRIHNESSFGAKDVHELEEHIDTAGSRGLYHFLMFKDYVKLAATADLGMRRRSLLVERRAPDASARPLARGPASVRSVAGARVVGRLRGAKRWSAGQSGPSDWPMERWMATEPKLIGLFGLFGIGNIGNDGSLEAMLRFARKVAPEHDVLCICGDTAVVERDSASRQWPSILLREYRSVVEWACSCARSQVEPACGCTHFDS